MGSPKQPVSATHAPLGSRAGPKYLPAVRGGPGLRHGRRGRAGVGCEFTSGW